MPGLVPGRSVHVTLVFSGAAGAGDSREGKWREMTRGGHGASAPAQAQGPRIWGSREWASFWGFTALLPKPAFRSPLFFSFLFVSARTHACSAALVAPDSAVPWAVAHQAPLSTGFSRQEHRSGLPWPPPGDLPDSGIRLTSLAFPTSAGGLFSTGAAREVPSYQPKMTRSTICSMPGALNVCSFNTPQNCTKHALFSLYHK